MIAIVVARVRGAAWQCVSSWRTTSCAAGDVVVLGAYLLGHLSTEQALVLMGGLSSLGKLFAKDAARK